MVPLLPELVSLLQRPARSCCFLLCGEPSQKNDTIWRVYDPSQAGSTDNLPTFSGMISNSSCLVQRSCSHPLIICTTPQYLLPPLLISPQSLTSAPPPRFSSLGLLHNRCVCSAIQLELHHEAATETESKRDGQRERGSTDGFYYCARTRTTRVRTHSHTGLMNRRKVSSQNGTIPRYALRNAEAEKRAGARRGGGSGGSGRITGNKTAEPGPVSRHLPHTQHY